MRVALLFYIALSFGLSFTAVMADDYRLRTWTNNKGETLTATLTHLSGSTAYLDDDGTQVVAPISRLSQEDQQWLKKVRELNRWREWTMLDGSTQRAKLDSVVGDTLLMKTRESDVDIEWSLNQISDRDRDLIGEVYGGSHTGQEGGFGSFGGVMAGTPPDLSDKLGTVRDWTDVEGKRITAEFRGLEGNKVVLFFKNLEYRVPLSQLSFADKDWVNNPLTPDNTNSNGYQIANLSSGNDDNRFGSTGGDSTGSRNASATDSAPYQYTPSNLPRRETIASQPQVKYQPPENNFSQQISANNSAAMEQSLRNRQNMGRTPYPRPSLTTPTSSANKSKEPNMIGVVIQLVGGVFNLIGGIWLLVVAAHKSIGWLLACIFVPFAALVFIIKHWEEAGPPFTTSLLGFILSVVGAVITVM